MNIRQHRVNALPAVLERDAIYYVIGATPGQMRIYVVGNDGVAREQYGPPGEIGPEGSQGPQGPQGPEGPPVDTTNLILNGGFF